MGFIYCPECKSKISDSAMVCPQCGFQSKGMLIHISELQTYEPVPTFQFPEAAIFDDGGSLIPFEENYKLVEFFGKAENLNRIAPEILEAIKKMMPKDQILVADINDEMKKLIKKGILKLTVDKDTGAFLASLKKVGERGFYKNIRLKQMDLPQDIAPAMANLRMQLLMAEIVNEIKKINESVAELHLEMRYDKIAKAESVWYQLQQANKIKDSRLKETKILNILSATTESRYIMQRDFLRNLNIVSAGGNSKKVGAAGEDALINLLVIAQLVMVEYSSYSLLGENDAARLSMEQFNQFIIYNKLIDRNNLLKINEFSRQDKIQIVDDFLKVTSNLDKALSEYKRNEEKLLFESNKEVENGKEM